MKPKHYSGALEHTDDPTTETAAKTPKRKTPFWLAALAAALALCIGALAFFRPTSVAASGWIAVPEYPKLSGFPNTSDYDDTDAFLAACDEWTALELAQRQQEALYRDGLNAFLRTTAPGFLPDGTGQNFVYSPLNVYLALSMLAEITDGESRAQILALLGADDMEALRQETNDIWRANYRNTEELTSLLADSVWLNENIAFRQETLDRLAEEHFAASYQGNPEALNRALREWLDEQTGGMLREQAQDIKLDPETVIALASTVRFHAQWADQFEESATTPDIFHAPDGDRTVDFMHCTDSCGYLYRGEGFYAVHKGLAENSSMWLFLPDEGVTPEELLRSGEALELSAAEDWPNAQSCVIHLAMPKFDVTSELDLRGGLRKLGVEDVFDSTRSDFSPLTDQPELYISQAEQAARVTVDENGCSAAAFVVLGGIPGSAAPPDEEFDFTLDRPFLFLLTGATGQPLFLGVVNQP